MIRAKRIQPERDYDCDWVLQFCWRLMLVVGCRGSQSGGSVPSCQLRRTFAPSTPMLYDGNILSLSSRRSRSLFLGNMPDTACRIIWGSRTSILWRHSWHRAYFVRVFPHLVFIRCLLQAAGKHGVFAEQELLVLVSGDLDVSRVGDNHVVPAVHCTS